MANPPNPEEERTMTTRRVAHRKPDTTTPPDEPLRRLGLLGWLVTGLPPHGRALVRDVCCAAVGSAFPRKDADLTRRALGLAFAEIDAQADAERTGERRPARRLSRAAIAPGPQPPQRRA